MIQSMTGYGRVETSTDTKNILVEIRSLNSKNLDLKTRIPSSYREKEAEIRKMIGKELKRGKVDFSFSIENISEKPQNIINRNILSAYLSQLKSINPEADETQLLVACLRLPEALKTEKEKLDENEWSTIKEHIFTAISRLISYRKDEGRSLEKDLELRLTNINNHLSEIIKLDNNRIDRIRERLRTAVDQLKVDIDKNRFEQELIYYLEKYDINEEKVRLNNHLEYFKKELQKNEDLKGKKLGFISQEIGREINTIGSKANDSNIQQYVVKMKDELEKIKEQVLNAL